MGDAAAGRHPEGAGCPAPGAVKGGRGPDPGGEGATRATRGCLADRRRDRHSPDRCRATSFIRPIRTGWSSSRRSQPISVIFTLPETDLSNIQQQMAKGPLTVVRLQPGRQDQARRRHARAHRQPDRADDRHDPAQGRLSQRGHLLWPGELVNARLLLETRHDGLTVAASAVQQGPNGAYVYVIGAGWTVADAPRHGRADQRRQSPDRLRVSAAARRS